MLSNFQLGDQALLQSFLIGQPELRVMMQSPQMQQLRQRVIASYHLGPLDKSETQAYIEHRLHHVGWKDDPRFEPACFELIHSLSGGIPRRINTLCNRLMLAGFLGEKHVLDVADVQAIAREIRDEMGPGATLGPVPASAPYAPPPAVAAVAAEPVVRSAAATVSAAAPPHDAEAWQARFREIEERMDRLEKLVNSAVNLLHRSLLTERGGKPGAPAKR